MNFCIVNEKNTLHKILPVILLTGASFATADQVLANPITASYVDLPQCNNYGPIIFTEELGGTHTPDPGAIQTGGETAAPFSADEWISWTSVPATPNCVADDGIANDWLVSITNQSNRTFWNVFFVTDSPGDNQIGNADGKINGYDAVFVTSVLADAQTVSFNVTNFIDLGGLNRSPFFGSLGITGASSSDADGSIASIVAEHGVPPVPEPSSILGLGAVVLGGLVMRKKK